MIVNTTRSAVSEDSTALVGGTILNLAALVIGEQAARVWCRNPISRQWVSSDLPRILVDETTEQVPPSDGTYRCGG